MKTRNTITHLVTIGIAVLFVSCSETLNGVDETIAAEELVKSTETTAVSADSCTFNGILSEADIAGLYEMREEEKLARDVYIYFYEKYEHLVFNNISKSEDAHTSAVLYLINGYGLEDVALPGEGNFSNPLFADLYEQLTKQGSTDLLAALKVGAFIEEYDIADLWKLIDETENIDMKRVYSNLLRGSEFHLRAFSNAIKQQGSEYEPTIISAEQYYEILDNSSDSENVEDTETNTTPPANCVGTGPNS